MIQLAAMLRRVKPITLVRLHVKLRLDAYRENRLLKSYFSINIGPSIRGFALRTFFLCVEKNMANVYLRPYDKLDHVRAGGGEAFAHLFGAVGAFLIIFGGLKSTVQIISREILKKNYTYNQIRREFTDKIVFGLEFFIAADVLSTLIAPTHEELIVLGAVVIIRTILGYFLSKEAQEYQLE
jgi:uncharacterized membrane protein